jgi:hypothetical protein
MTILPVALPSVSAWQLRDFLSPSARSAPAAGGLATVEFAQVDPSELWLIDHAIVSCTSSTRTTVRLYAGAINAATLIDGSSSGNFDVGDWPAGLQVQSTIAVIAQWSGASDGAIATISLQLRSLRI